MPGLRAFAPALLITVLAWTACGDPAGPPIPAAELELAGALAGALHGLSGVPAAWVAALSHERPGVARVVQLADRISRIKSGGGGAA